MIDFGIVKPGTTLYVPFATYDSNDPTASVTMTGLAVTDIEIYKDGGTTQRASDAGYTLLDTDGIDFDSLTGIHGFSINLADNTTAGFYAAGSQYFVVVSSITVDAGTISFIAARFTIGYPDAWLNTTIATLASQTSFTLTAGPAEDNALNGCVCCIHDVASAVQAGFAVISAYTGSTKTVTLTAGTTFTAAATDNIAIYPPGAMSWVVATAATNLASAITNYSATRGLSGTALPAAAADAAGGLPISDAGGLDLDTKLANTNEVTAARMGALTDWINGGRLDLILDDILVDTGTTLQGELDGIQADTEDIQARLPAALVSGRIDASVGAMAANVLTATAINADAITAAKVAADVTTEIQSGLATAAELAKVPKSDSTVTWNATALASINAEVVDALNVDTYAEPGQGTPAATLSLAAKIGYLFKSWRNKKTQTSTTWSLFNDDTSTVDQKATVADDGTTTTKGEIATGP